VCVAQLALATFLTFVAVMAVHEDGSSATPLVWVTTTICALCLLGATYLWRTRVILTASRIETGSFRLRGLDRDDVAGFRLIPTPLGTRVLVIPRDTARHHRVEFVVEAIRADNALVSWIDGLPNLDEHPA
jgi:hypothetical protein